MRTRSYQNLRSGNNVPIPPRKETLACLLIEGHDRAGVSLTARIGLGVAPPLYLGTGPANGEELENTTDSNASGESGREDKVILRSESARQPKGEGRRVGLTLDQKARNLDLTQSHDSMAIGMLGMAYEKL